MEGSGPGIPAPLNEPPEDCLYCYDRLLLLNGLQLERQGRPTAGCRWLAIGDEGLAVLDVQLAKELLADGLACVAVTDAWQELRWFSASRVRGPGFDLVWQNLDDQAARMLSEELRPLARNTVYILGAVTHHLRNLGALYSDIPRRHFIGPVAGHFKGERVVLHREIEPYFEIEALITAIVRSYETMRYFLWSRYGSGLDCPRKFSLVVEALELPNHLGVDALLWRDRYVRLRDYRDCLQHNAHFGARLPFSMAVRVSGYWALFNRLPDNPEAKSYERFTFAEELDALRFAWTAANDVVEMVCAVFGEVTSGAL